jgi:hypothetical protein
MTAVRVGMFVFFIVTISDVAMADPYTYYQVSNTVPQPITFEHHESAGKACTGSMDNIWQGALFIVSTEYLTGTASCVVVLTDGSLGVGTIAPVAGTCPGDQRFDFDLQQCGDWVNLEQVYAVVLASFLWVCLIGGMLVGFRAGT